MRAALQQKHNNKQSLQRMLLSIIALFIAANSLQCTNAEIEDGLAAANRLLYKQNYTAADNLLSRVLEKIEAKNNPDLKSQKLLILQKLSNINIYHRQDYTKAIRLLNIIVNEYPKSEAAYNARIAIAEIYAEKLRQPAQAIVAYQELISTHDKRPNIAQFQYKLANTYFQMKNFEQAREAAQALLHKWPRSQFVGKSQVLIANTYYIQEEYQKALEIYEALYAQKNPEINQGLIEFEIGNCYQMLDQLEKALEYLYRALKTHPNPMLVQRQIAHLRQLYLSIKPEEKKKKRRRHARSVTNTSVKKAPDEIDEPETPIDNQTEADLETQE